jgi:putative aminopeptidase FrvX
MLNLDFQLLKTLCSIHATSGDELPVKTFLLNYIKEHQLNWKSQPEIFQGNGFQDCLVLAFGKPRTAVFVHMDSIGFSVRYDNELIRIGAPLLEEGIRLVGEDKNGKVDGKIKFNKKRDVYVLDFERIIEPGTRLTFYADFVESKDSVQCCYMDNRLGLFAALKLAETLENGIICFSCWEEHGGGSVGYLTRFITEQYQVFQALICDITWVTSHVHAGEGVVVSLRDSGLPRKSYIDKIKQLALESGFPVQFEVEGSGGSDGNEIQKSPYPVDWCFVGAPENNVHSPTELVHKADIDSMIKLYEYLMVKL